MTQQPMPSEPPEVPPVPQDIFDAARQGKLIIFVGAGVSQLVGGPLWKEFADKLLAQLTEGNCLSHSELDQLNSLDPKKKISISMDICEGNGFKPDFRKILQPQAATDLKKIYQDLYSIGTSFVTTNYDEWLDQLAEGAHLVPQTVEIQSTPELQSSSVQSMPGKKVFYRRDDLTVEKLSVLGNIVHLHGSVKEPETMILTTRQYLEHYGDPKVITFLAELFAQYTVLFIGYGLEEDEILEHIFRKRPQISAAQAKVKRHCRLFQVFSHEVNLLRHLTQYHLNHCDVQLVPFCIDKHGHDQLTTVVSEWARQLRAQVRESGYLAKTRIIDEALNEQS